MTYEVLSSTDPRAQRGARSRPSPPPRAPTAHAPGLLSPARVLELQRTGGNAAVIRLLARLATGLEEPPLATGGPCCEACAAGEPCEDEGQPAAALDAVAPDFGAAGPDHLTSPRFAGDPVLEACFEDRARLAPGAVGTPVAAVQQALIDLGYDLGRWGADGDYGAATAAAVRAFKRDEELGFEAYGDVGPGTMHRLDYLFPPPDGAPLCRDDDVDPIITAAAPELEPELTGEPMGGGATLGFAIPGAFCQLRPAIAKFADIPLEVRRRLKVAIWSPVDQKAIDDAYQPWSGTLRDPQPKPPARIPQAVLFGGGVPATPVVRESLKRVAELTMSSPTKTLLPPSATTNLELGGSVRDGRGGMMPGGVFRFTRFKVGKSPETLLIEGLGAPAEPPPSYFTGGRAAFTYVWQAKKFSLASGGWDDKRIGQLQFALLRCPPKALALMHDVTFEYVAKPAGATEDGRWDSPTKTLSLYFGVFDASAQRIGTIPYWAFVTLHELGHATEMTFDPGAKAPFVKALNDDGGSPATDNLHVSDSENFAEAFAVFAADPDELKALRPNVADLFFKRYVGP